MTALSTNDALARISALNPRLNAFITLADAKALNAPTVDGPLHGLPISIKDIIDVAGMPTTAASRVREGEPVAATDALVVERLRNAGAIIIGKTNLHEFALGITNEESAFGPARNPHNPSRSPGGSSGGSAISVATCMSWASIGTDTGGSIRIPAAACGIVGLKPSFGEIPTAGVIPLSVSLDHVGPMTRSISDAWLLFDILKGDPPGHQTPRAIGDVTLGRLGGYFAEKVDPDVRSRFEETLQRLKAAGATIIDVRVSKAADVPAIYPDVTLPEVYAYHSKMLETMRDRYSPGVADRMAGGASVSRERYIKGQGDRGVLRDQVDRALGRCDALVLPTLPIPAPTIGSTTINVDGTEELVRPMMLRHTQLFNLTGHPALSMPCGFTREGLPCGFQMVGRRKETAALLAVALGCEPVVSVQPFSCAGGS